jgi:hypothetical protein
LSAASLSQLSATMNSPAMQNPDTTLNAIHPAGATASAWRSTALDAIDANAAKTRMWPTVATRRGAWVDPMR